MQRWDLAEESGALRGMGRGCMGLQSLPLWVSFFYFLPSFHPLYFTTFSGLIL